MRKTEHDIANYPAPTSKKFPLTLVGDVIHALRVPQWSKNLLVFLPALITHSFEAQTLASATMAFTAFCLVASAAYVINDLSDLESDRGHHTKCKRAFADNRLEPRMGYAMIAILFILGALVASQLPWQFGLVLIFYVCSSIAYTLLFKRMLGLDVVVIACLYVLRIVAGDEAIGAQFEGIDSSNWILGFSCLFFLSLALIKRCSELATVRTNAGEALAGRAYGQADYPVLLAFAAASAMASIVILMRYIDSSSVTESFSNPDLLWLVVPVLVYWLVRTILLANRGMITEDPVLFTLRDGKSQICVVAAVLATLAAW